MVVVVHSESFEVEQSIGPDVADITPAVARIVARSGVQTGSVHVTAIGSTGSVTAIEFEPGAVADLRDAIRRLAPPEGHYAHEQAWHDGNGHSHVQAALLGPSMVVPVRAGKVRLGTWQQLIAINHDNRPRRRVVEVTVIGEA